MGLANVVDLQKGLLRTPEPVPAEKPKAPWDQDKSEKTPLKETEDESESSITSTERIEDAIYELYDSAGSARGYLDMKEVVEHLKKRLKDFEKLTSSWSLEKTSFELQTVSNGSVQIKLTQGAMDNAEMRKTDRTNSLARKREMQVAETVWPALTENIPTNLSQTELCALLVKAADTRSRGRPAKVLAVLVPEATKDKLDTVTLLKDIRPFHASHLMRSIVRCESACPDSQFKAESLLRLIHVSALDIIDSTKKGGKPKPILPVVTESLRAMIHKPFSEVIKSRKPQIVAQCFMIACCRALQEMNGGFVMSKTYSTFNAFAEFVQAMANFYSTFRAYMPDATVKDGKRDVGAQDADAEVPKLIDKLKSACQQALKQKVHPEDPQGLHRLVWTFANFGHEFEKIREPTVKPALHMISELLCSLHFKEETGWTVTILAALVTSYRMAGVASEGLFRKIALALTELVKKNATFKRDHVTRTVEAFKGVGFPKLLDGFLGSLRSKQWFKNELGASPKEETAPLLLAMVLVKDDAAVKEFTNYLSSCRHVSEFSFKDISSLMKELHNIPTNAHVTTARGTLWQAAMTQLDRKKTLPAPEDIENLLQVAQSESELRKLRESCEHGKRLETLPKPDKSWKDLAAAFKSMLGPFSQAKERVERLEAACGARLMQFIDRRLYASSYKARSVSIQDLAPAALEIPVEAIAGMPALTTLIARFVSKEEIPKDDAGKSLFIKLVSHLLKALKQPATHPDEEFESWVKHTEAAVDQGAGLKVELLEQTLNKYQKQDKASHQNMKEALGQNWCTILLARCEKLAWSGGDSLRHEPTRPRASLRALATHAESILGPLTGQVLQLEEEKAPQTQAKSQPPKKPAPAATANAAPTGRERSRSRDAGVRVPGGSPPKRTSTELAKTTDVPMPPAKKASRLNSV
ncbi:unnamed protein product [Symbiodinium sp. CCMP2456]|nr:unnamed protein product [Symbiodinium sp. CCMP2456]